MDRSIVDSADDISPLSYDSVGSVLSVQRLIHLEQKEDALGSPLEEKKSIKLANINNQGSNISLVTQTLKRSHSCLSHCHSPDVPMSSESCLHGPTLAAMFLVHTSTHAES